MKDLQPGDWLRPNADDSPYRFLVLAPGVNASAVLWVHEDGTRIVTFVNNDTVHLFPRERVEPRFKEWAGAIAKGCGLPDLAQ